MTTKLFEADAYLQNCDAEVVAVNDLHGIILSQTVFYPTGGGQPGDRGTLRTADGREVTIATTIKADGDIIHVPTEDGYGVLQAGDQVEVAIDWETRYKHMRMHTSMHLLCACIPVAVTGGQVGAEKSRLDFNSGDLTLDKEAVTEQLNRLIAEAHDVTPQWITDEELTANPELVRTMSVSPPQGSGKVRLLKIGEVVDLQPCGGTHVKNTSEIGSLRVSKIENKGAQNRRVHIVFGDT